MPELPEVETTKRGVAPHIVNQSVQDVVIRQPQLRWPISEGLKSLLLGKKLDRIERRAKYLLLFFEDLAPGALMVHLGMSGSLRIVQPEEPPLKHDHVDLQFSNSNILRYSDPRRFGCILWIDQEPKSHKLLSSLGPEPLSDEFSGEYLWNASRGLSVSVKQFVMDQKRVTGIGNIYATEALFEAKVRPTRPAGKVSKASYEKFVTAAKRILQNAIEQGGTTLRDFVGGDGKPGYFKQQLLVYGRKGEKCKVCDSELKETRLSNRASVFCPTCQK